MKPLKPWLAFSQQLEVLQERGLQVEDRAAALDYLGFGEQWNSEPT